MPGDWEFPVVNRDESRLSASLERDKQNGALPQNILNRCLRWLKPPQAQPPRRMLIDGRVASETGTHQAWRHMLRAQCTLRHPVAGRERHLIELRVQQQVASARSRVGMGQHDAQVSEAEATRILAECGAANKPLITSNKPQTSP